MNKLFLAVAAALALGFTACSDDDDNQKQAETQYTDVYRFKYDNTEDDSTETALVRATYTQELNIAAADNYDSLTVSGKDTTACLQQLGQMIERADSLLSLKTFSTHPCVTVYNQNDSLVYQQVYGEGENSNERYEVEQFPVVSLTDHETWDNQDLIANLFVGEIRLGYIYGCDNSKLYSEYIVRSGNLNDGSNMDSNKLYFIAADNYQKKYIEDDWTHYELSPVTDVVVYDRTASDDKELKETIMYNGRSYKLAGEPADPYVNDRGKGHEITLYYCNARGTGKRLMMRKNYTAHGFRLAHRKWWWLTPFHNNTYIQYFKANIADYDIEPTFGTGNGFWKEVTPMVATRNGQVVKISDEANMNEGVSNAAYIHMILNYKHDSSY